MICVPYNGNMDTDMHKGRMPREDNSREEGDASSSQEIPKTGSIPSEARRGARNIFSLIALRRNRTC